LTGEIPTYWLADLTKLIHLNLQNNSLTGLIPTSIGNLISLTFLSLGVNRLSGDIPASLGNLYALTALDLSDNQLSGLIPESVGFLYALTDLHLNENKLSREIPGSLSNLTSLTYLSIDNNLLHGPAPRISSTIESCSVLGNAGICAAAGYSNICSLGLTLCSIDSAILGSLPSTDAINKASFDTLDPEMLPLDCFYGIAQRCEDPDRSTEYSCSNNEISDALARNLINEINPDIFKSPLMRTLIRHNSICLNSSESTWFEAIQVISGLEEAVLQRSPSVSVVSFLQLKVNSFGTSSVQYACFYVNGDEQEFSSIVGGIILGYSISESQYDCSHFVPATALVENFTTTT
jgi:Leucine-rich repeat (LRR) protein